VDSGTLISSTLRSSPTVGGSCGRGNECDVWLAILSRNIFVKVVRTLKASLEDSNQSVVTKVSLKMMSLNVCHKSAKRPSNA